MSTKIINPVWQYIFVLLVVVIVELAGVILVVVIYRSLVNNINSLHCYDDFLRKWAYKIT
jgi:hypothetical protein